MSIHQSISIHTTPHSEHVPVLSIVISDTFEPGFTCSYVIDKYLLYHLKHVIIHVLADCSETPVNPLWHHCQLLPEETCTAIYNAARVYMRLLCMTIKNYILTSKSLASAITPDCRI